jgi:hypothetical protein
MPASPASPTATSTSGHGEVEISVQFSWRAAGRVVLDGQGKPMFDSLPEVAGLYRLTLGGGLVAARRPRIYIGETDRIRRRLAGNYRNAGPTQATSLRINALLREHLRSGGLVELGIATEAWCSLNGRSPAALDLAEKAARLLAETQRWYSPKSPTTPTSRTSGDSRALESGEDATVANRPRGESPCWMPSSASAARDAAAQGL